MEPFLQSFTFAVNPHWPQLCREYAVVEVCLNVTYYDYTSVIAIQLMWLSKIKIIVSTESHQCLYMPHFNHPHSHSVWVELMALNTHKCDESYDSTPPILSWNSWRHSSSTLLRKTTPQMAHSTLFFTLPRCHIWSSSSFYSTIYSCSSTLISSIFLSCGSGCACSWIAKCVFKSPEDVNVSWQTSHLYGFSTEWTPLQCFFRFPARLKDLLHT